MNTHKYWGKTIASFLLVLFTMPLGHALMRVMEDTMTVTALHYSAFAMGAVGLAIVIWGVFVKGDVKQTLMGLFGGLLFWTGWVEFLFGYFLIAELDCCVAFLLFRHLRSDHAGTCFNDSHRNDLAGFVKNLSHADFFANDGFLHSISSCWLLVAPLGPGMPVQRLAT